VYKLIKENQLK